MCHEWYSLSPFGHEFWGAPVTVIQSFTATGEWVCPTGVTEVEYLACVAGGGGGVRLVAAVAGGFRTGTGFSVTAGTTYTVTVGAGGRAGAAASENKRF
jgi:hypothetical protein